MPLYEYKCKACGETFEILQKFSDEPLKVHASCGGAVERLISPPAFQFKGSGWYITDYGKSHTSSPNGHNGKNSPNGHNGKNGSSEKSETASKTPESKPAPAPQPASKS